MPTIRLGGFVFGLDFFLGSLVFVLRHVLRDGIHAINKAECREDRTDVEQDECDRLRWPHTRRASEVSVYPAIRKPVFPLPLG